jgi:Arc/MetJ family transcription regulator
MGVIIWVTHMKTTIELSDGLLAEARRVARREGLTLKALLELGLRRAIDERKGRRSFRLRDASVPGKGLSREMKAAGWEAIRDLAYRDHGA